MVTMIVGVICLFVGGFLGAIIERVARGYDTPPEDDYF